jgi:hypothetical protein
MNSHHKPGLKKILLVGFIAGNAFCTAVALV